MKKTMLALMATVGLAFGAKADPLNSTGFESYTGDFAYDLNDSGEALAPRYWVVTNATPDLNGTGLTAYGVPPAYVPWAFTNTANNTYLKVDTSNEVLYRSVEAVNDVNALNAGTAIGKGLYFDANVQFTASDGDVTPETGDKLVVWLKADDQNNTTNLVVTAGVLNGISGEYDPTPFEIDGTYSADTWYRLTVKAMIDDGLTKFVVYVDDEQLKVGGTAAVFNSLVQTGDNKATLTAVGFMGTGAIDNLVWTTEDPFPVVEPDSFTVNVTLTDDEYQVGEWTLNDEDKTGEDEATADILVAADAEIKVTITVYTDVTVAATVGGVAVPAENITSAPGEEDSTVYTITIDGSSYVDGDTVELAITVTADEEPPTPSDTHTIDPATESLGENGTLPVEAGTTTIKIGDYNVTEAFKIVGTTATLLAPVVADTAAEEDDAFVIDDEKNEVTINVNPVAGLYYGVDKKTNLGALARPETLTQYTGENKAAIFTVTKPEGTAGFFKVYVDIKATK